MVHTCTSKSELIILKSTRVCISNKFIGFRISFQLSSVIYSCVYLESTIIDYSGPHSKTRWPKTKIRITPHLGLMRPITPAVKCNAPTVKTPYSIALPIYLPTVFIFDLISCFVSSSRPPADPVWFSYSLKIWLLDFFNF